MHTENGLLVDLSEIKDTVKDADVFAAAFRLFPVLVIAGFGLVAALIGTLWAWVLLLATTVLGIVVLRQAGRGQLAGFRVAVSDRNVTALEAASGSFLMVLGGILRVLPGLITDIIGLLLLLGPIRRWFSATLRRTFESPPGDRSVVDLQPDEWRQIPDTELEQRRHRGSDERDKRV